MFSKEMSQYRKALVFGTGGGNDIVSAILPALYLQDYGIKTDIGGILSPAAVHTFNGGIERVVNRLEGDIRRYIPAKEPVPLSFLDSMLPKFGPALNIANFYDFSVRYGTSALADGLGTLIKENSYDLVVAVDVGGDILARGAQDPGRAETLRNA